LNYSEETVHWPGEIMQTLLIHAHRAPDPAPIEEPSPEPFPNPHPHHPPVPTPQQDPVPDHNPSLDRALAAA
jgi:hypothetical protein